MTRNSFISKYFCFNSKIPRYFSEYSLTFLFVLIGIDAIFMGLHALNSLGYTNNPNFSITLNWGYAEIFMYLKAAFITGILLWLGSKHKYPQLLCWAFVFLYVLLDDSLEIHEYLGYHAGEQLENAGVAGGKTLGELLVFAVLGLIVFIPLFYFFFRSQHRSLKIMTQDLFMLFVIMLFFGIGVDVLHDMAEVGTMINGVLGLVEDAGEMMVMSMMAWYVWTVSRSDNFLKEEKKASKETSKEAKATFQAKRKTKDRPSLKKPSEAQKQKLHRP